MGTSSPGLNVVVGDYGPVSVFLGYDPLPVSLAKLGLALASAAGSYIPECWRPLSHQEARMEQTVRFDRFSRQDALGFAGTPDRTGRYSFSWMVVKRDKYPNPAIT
jgi:hypothetical protein